MTINRKSIHLLLLTILAEILILTENLAIKIVNSFLSKCICAIHNRKESNS